MIRFRTASGRRIDLEHPRPEDFTLEDIARGLSHTCRFAGQLDRFYSVAQHSILVARLANPSMYRHALLHDASEAYLGDLSRYLKHSEYLAGYRVIEQRVTAAIEMQFQLHDTIQLPGVKEHLKVADDLAACFEHATLQEAGGWRGRETLEILIADGYVKSSLIDLLRLCHRLPEQYHAWSPFEAHRQFLHGYVRYWERIHEEMTRTMATPPPRTIPGILKKDPRG